VISEAETIGKECCAQISGITTGGEEYNRELKLRVYANDKREVEVCRVSPKSIPFEIKPLLAFECLIKPGSHALACRRAFVCSSSTRKFTKEFMLQLL
jgi:hypothetical protein